MSNRIVALFENQEQAGQAVQALTASDVNFEDYRVIEASDKAQNTKTVMPAMNPGNSISPAGVTAPAASAANPVFNLGLADEQARFYEQGLQEGGVVLVVDSADEAGAKIASIFDNFGGRVAGDSAR